MTWTFFSLVAAVVLATSPAVAAEIPLLPSARSVAIGRGRVQLDQPWQVLIETALPADSFAAGLLQGEAGARGWHWPPASAAGRPAIIVRERARNAAEPALMAAQGYVLEIAPDRILVEASFPAGRYYAIQTLRQLVRSAPGRFLPAQRIVDYPSLEWRGVSEDMARGQVPTVSWCDTLIAQLGEYKLNMLCLYLEDAFVFPSAAEVGRGRTRLTAADLCHLVETARRHHIEIVPIVETLGHQSRLLSRPEFQDLAEMSEPSVVAWRPHTIIPKLIWWARSLMGNLPESTGQEAWSFAPAVPEARRFARQLVSDLARTVPTKYLHIGGDEAGDIGRGASREMVAREGLGVVLAGYLGEMSTAAAADGRRAVVYSDGLLAHPEAIRTLAPKATIMHWDYDPTPSRQKLIALRDSGFTDVVVSGGVWNWSSFAPNLGRAFPNIRTLTEYARQGLAVGAITASWGDNGSESLRDLNWPAYAYQADLAWTSATPVDSAFIRRFVAVHYGVRRPEALAYAQRVLGWQQFDRLGWYGRIYHRRPDIRRRTAVWRHRMMALRSDAREALDALAAASPSVARHLHQVAVLQHVGGRFSYIADRELLLDSLATTPPRDSLDVVRQRLALEALRQRAENIRVEYEALWRATARPSNLAVERSRLMAQEAGLAQLESSLRLERDAFREPGPDHADF